MILKRDLINTEKKYIGEYTRKNAFNGYKDLAWCGLFQKYCMEQAGMENPFTNLAYCPQIETDARAQGRWKLTGRRGNLVLFDFNYNGIADHVGLVLGRNADGSYTTIEGNTSGANDANGNCVQIRTRYPWQIRGFVRLSYRKKKYFHEAHPFLKFPKGDLDKGDKGREVRRLQRFLKWALKTDLKIDSKYGALTVRAVREFRQKVGLDNLPSWKKDCLKKAKEFKR